MAPESLRTGLRTHNSRRGLTLLELVVVLAILVAIGGLLVPLLGNYLHRANIASCTTNIPELDKWIQTYANLHAEYPDRLDNLVGGSGLVSYVLPGDYNGQPSIVLGTLADDAEAKSLSDAGIANLCNLVEKPTADAGDWCPTFWPYGANKAAAPTTTAVAKDVKVATVTETGARLMGIPWGATNNQYKYVVFGMNSPCTLFRNTVEEAPYHFADTPAEDPATYYMCFGAVFMIRDGEGNALKRAKYMGTVAFHDFGLSTAGAHTKEWWDRMKEERPSK